MRSAGRRTQDDRVTRGERLTLSSARPSSARPSSSCRARTLHNRGAMRVKIRKRPRLVIVSGSSASGKSSIARELAAELELAYLALDDVKEGLFDSLGVPKDEAESERLDIAVYLLIDRL